MVIHRYDMAEPDVRSAVEEVEKAITARDGNVKETDFWGKRRFAYDINQMNEGYYSVIMFEGDPDLENMLDRSLSLLDSVVRHKIFRKTA
jgi:small subunit ribosomal protein S6